MWEDGVIIKEDRVMSIFFIITIIAVVLASLRFVFGPQFFDRMVAVDILTTILIGFMVVLSVLFGEKIFLDVALALAAVSFVAMIIVGRFIEG